MMVWLCNGTPSTGYVIQEEARERKPRIAAQHGAAEKLSPATTHGTVSLVGESRCVGWSDGANAASGLKIVAILAAGNSPTAFPI